MQFYELFEFILKVAFVVIVFLSIVIGVIVPLYQNFSRRAHSRSIESPVRYRRQTASSIVREEEEVEIPATGKSQGEHHRDIVKMALEDPDKTALLVRNWIQEKKH